MVLSAFLYAISFVSVLVGQELSSQEALDAVNASQTTDAINLTDSNSSHATVAIQSFSVEGVHILENETLASNASHPVISQGTCRLKTFLEIVYGDFCAVRTATDDIDDDENSEEITTVTRRVVCLQRKLNYRGHAELNSNPSVVLFNSSQLLAHLGSRGNGSVVGRCTVVLFYAPWCTFCVRLAPHYNALARAFPMLDVVAIDAYHFSSLSSRFGTIAVPNIMLFHNAKAVARFNGTERTVASIAAFISNITGIVPQSSVEVVEQDYIGPLSSELVEEPDYMLALSWLFVIVSAVVAGIRSATGRRVWNTFIAIGNHGQARHLHID